MATPGSPTSQPIPLANSPRRTTFQESPRPSNLSGPRSPTSYSYGGIASPTAQFHDSAHAGPSSPPGNNQHLPGDASYPSSPTRPTVARLHSSSVSAPSNDHAAVAAALGRGDRAGWNDQGTKRRWAWRWILLWATLLLVLVAAVVVGVTVSTLRHKEANRNANIEEASATTSRYSATSSALVTSKAGTSSAAASSPFPTSTPYTSPPPSTSIAGPTSTITSGDPLTVESFPTSSRTTTRTDIPASGD
ncbi:hypothetical protein FS749_015715 [Ceratobasidium sp. UAMH 11750]|nr:hypothetical protein FS749_015715 [Ceratobasidium sp. UAMH 11750]